MKFRMRAQPDDVSCGPTCLQSVYRYYGEKISLKKVLSEVPMLEQGGTLGVSLGLHALRRGYQVKLYTYNLNVFDPSWFKSPEISLVDKLNEQKAAKRSKKLGVASKEYIQFLESGGEILFEELSARRIRYYLGKNIPILTGLSATYLYQSSRETDDCEVDDIKGYPTGHFVVLSGFDRKRKKIKIHDPYVPNPFTKSLSYAVSVDRLIGAIFLGVLTYDSNLLVITK